MSNQSVLAKAIEKAIAGGWTDYNSLESLTLISTTANTVTLEGWVEYVEDGETDEAKTQLTFNYKELIFNHDFAKALWGEGIYYKLNDAKKTPRPYWQHMLQQMVIAEDPIKYLGENLPD